MLEIILFIVAYLLGSFPSGVWVGKAFYQMDIREHGSKSSGTTNTFRVLGKKAGFAVFLMDMLKGTLATLLPILFGVGLHPILFGLAAIIGHVFPIFAKFKGGKAIATSAGVALALYPVFLIIMLLVWAGILYLSSMVSLASILTILIAFVVSLTFNDPVFVIVLFVILIIVIVRHKTNIQRIKNGNENKVPWGLRQDKKD